MYADEHVVLKLFPPVHAAAAPVESGVLQALAGSWFSATPSAGRTG